MSKKYLIGAVFLAIGLAFFAVFPWRKSWEKSEVPAPSAVIQPAVTDTLPPPEPPFARIPVTQEVAMEAYFKFMDALVRRYDTVVPYVLSEHLLVRANPWLIDTLENTDYYRRMARGQFVPDQRKMTILRAGDTLLLPGPQTAAALQASIKNTHLDINLPAFSLRIVEGDRVLYDFPVRIGKNEKKFLAMAGGRVDLRTHTGRGGIIRVNRDPVFYDPVTGKQFTHTKRDDHTTTRMPLIPWIEPSIDGSRYGQMIHPTTNPRTLGKAASNGCIGLREADAWRVYYYAPVGTKVVIRYDRLEINESGDTLRYPDVYPARPGRKRPVEKSVASMPSHPADACWCGR